MERSNGRCVFIPFHPGATRASLTPGCGRCDGDIWQLRIRTSRGRVSTTQAGMVTALIRAPVLGLTPVRLIHALFRTSSAGFIESWA